ncbi:MAG: carboxymuconolactone decarboxylase family protein [Novosphingobium sp.]|nr:carboxymuconolactone decarboxylase family protein [Novosphingobium sp.]
MESVILQALREYVAEQAQSLPDGEGLDPFAKSLIELALASSATALDYDAMQACMARAFTNGASLDNVEEIIALVSGLGVHSLMASQATLLKIAAAQGLIDATAPLTAEQQMLWDKHVGDDPFWIGFERENPGFLDSMLRISPIQFTAFFDYCAIPWKIGSVRALTKELAALACDMAPTHAFGPGLRVHLRNAIGLGANRRQITDLLELVTEAPDHRGIV